VINLHDFSTNIISNMSDREEVVADALMRWIERTSKLVQTGAFKNPKDGERRRKSAKVDERRRKTADYVVILKNSSKLVNKIHT